MRRFLTRLKSRLYGDRARLRRRLMGDAAEALDYLALDLTAPPGPPPVLPHGVIVERAAADDLLATPRRFSGDAANVALALSKGHRCLVARAGDEIAARVWVAPDQADVARMLGAERAGLLPASVLFDVFTDPAHRGRGLHRALMLAAAAEARRDGCRHVVTWVAAWNSVARRNCERVGFRPVPLPR